MNLTHLFAMRRFGYLLKMEWYRSRRGILITFVVTFGLLLTGFILESVFGYSKVYHAHPASYAFALLTGGFILSSLAFNDLSNSLRKCNFLMLPASAFEKFFSMWFLTCVCWIIAFTLVFIVYGLSANALGHLFFTGKTYLAFDPFGRIPLGSIKYYVVLQGVFLVGAVNFKGYVFPKTILSLLLVGMVCGVIFYFTMSDLFQTGEEFITRYSTMTDTAFYQVWLAVRWMFWWLLAPLCWLITYTGLKDLEV